MQKRQSHSSGVWISQGIDAVNGGLHLGDAAPGMLEHDLPVRVQAQPPIDPVEQRCAHVRFESTQGARQRWLADAQLRGCLGDVLDLGERDKPVQFLEMHQSTISGTAAVICARKSAVTAGKRAQVADAY
jgi:hypothetical protein